MTSHIDPLLQARRRVSHLVLPRWSVGCPTPSNPIARTTTSSGCSVEGSAGRWRASGLTQGSIPSRSQLDRGRRWRQAGRWGTEQIGRCQCLLPFPPYTHSTPQNATHPLFNLTATHTEAIMGYFYKQTIPSRFAKKKA